MWRFRSFKSASLLTVVCFPFLGGVLEIGTTEHVSQYFYIYPIKLSLFDALGDHTNQHAGYIILLIFYLSKISTKGKGISSMYIKQHIYNLP